MTLTKVLPLKMISIHECDAQREGWKQEKKINVNHDNIQNERRERKISLEWNAI